MESSNKPYSISFVEGSLWVLLVIIVIVDFFKYIFGISLNDILDKIKSFFRGGQENKEEEEEVIDEVTANANNENTVETQEKCKESTEIDDPES